MILQIAKRYTSFSALCQFVLMLPIFCAQVAAKCFFQDGCSLKFKKYAQRPNTKALV
jgi:hypothetical protein